MSETGIPPISSARRLQTVHGAASHTLGNDRVRLAVTRCGGHLAPVQFNLGARWVAPYSLAPWTPDEVDGGLPPMLRVLRGDFFCLPFGDDGEGGDPHGETANRVWKKETATTGRLRLRMALSDRPGVVTKTVSLRPTDRAVYQEHRIEGLSGRFNFGHHAILQFPEKGGPFFLNTSPFKYGATPPVPFTRPAIGEYGALKVGARFRSLAEVPLATGGTTSLHRYPAREGFEDLVMVTSRAGAFAWTAATLDGYVWISLKDPRVLPSTLFWFSNGGRHSAPWSGRHRGRVGLEEVCSHFADGPKIARKNPLGARVPTSRLFRAGSPVLVRMVHVVHPVPETFGPVARVWRKPGGEGIRISNGAGASLDVPVRWQFLFEGETAPPAGAAESVQR